MKKYTIILSILALSMTIGVAFADEFVPFMSTRDIGTALYDDAFTVQDAITVSHDFSRVVPYAANEGVEVGTGLYRDLLAADEAIGRTSVRGEAAGGVRVLDEKTIIWDNLMGAPGGSDLP